MTHLFPVLHFMTDAVSRHLGPAQVPAPDPFDHPALRRMSLRELADLPAPRPSAVDEATPRADGDECIHPAA